MHKQVLLVGMLLASIAVPFSARAHLDPVTGIPTHTGEHATATATTTMTVGTTTSTSTREENDDWNGQVGERIRGWRQRSIEQQQRINALGGAPALAIPIPILMGVAVADLDKNFGDPRSEGRIHEGLDIMAPKGAPIVSPVPAVVLRIGSGARSGNHVYTAGPGGETYVYMHLDRYAENLTEGMSLAAGDVVGYVGNTGNASGGASHLHFEIRSGGGAIDPFPRLAREHTLQERVASVNLLISRSASKTELATFLVSTYYDVFNAAQAANITLPSEITSAMVSYTPPASRTASPGTPTATPAGDLDVGSTGAAVVAVQQFLISHGGGVATDRLKAAGATGYFGEVTRAALAEYQAHVGISPATGYYGPVTRAALERERAGGHTGTAISTTATPAPTTPAVSPVSFTRDLQRGSVGEDVRALQQFLNNKNFTIATSGAGSPGNETTYFGAATEAALKRFQNTYGITPALGYFGPKTRAYIAQL